jgi:hypothetical protein
MQWRYEKETKTIRQVPENYWIATMGSFDGAINNAANANLIAAAPDMYEKLKWAYNFISQYMENEDYEYIYIPEYVNELVEWKKTTIAVLSKAEGK